MSLALRITTAAGRNEGTSKTINFPMTLSVYEACNMVREKINDPTNEGMSGVRDACPVVPVLCSCCALAECVARPLSMHSPLRHLLPRRWQRPRVVPLRPPRRPRSRPVDGDDTDARVVRLEAGGVHPFPAEPRTKKPKRRRR